MRTMHALAFTFVLFVLQYAPAYALAPQKISVAGMSVSVWMPDRSPDTKDGWPVVVFSHDFHGCGTQSAFLMEAIASAGYAVFAPNHRDAACDSVLKRLLPMDISYAKADRWNADVYANRAADLHTLLDTLIHDERYTTLDWGRIGIVGYGLGGYTVLGIAGGWPQWSDDRIKAAIVLSPYIAPYVAQHTLGKIIVPMMYEGGTQDAEGTPDVDTGGGYDLTPSPKFFVEFGGASHSAWADAQGASRLGIESYSVAFFDHYLKDLPFSEQFTKAQGGVAKLRTDLRR